MCPTDLFEPVGLVLLLRLSSCGNGYHLWVEKPIVTTYGLVAGDMLKIKLLGVKRAHSKEPGSMQPAAPGNPSGKNVTEPVKSCVSEKPGGRAE